MKLQDLYRWIDLQPGIIQKLERIREELDPEQV